MTPGAWIALLTTGFFVAFGCYANGAYPAPQARTFAEKQAMAAREAVEPVMLTVQTQTLKQRDVALAAGLRVVDTVAEAGERKREECGEDYACLLAWAGEKRP